MFPARRNIRRMLVDRHTTTCASFIKLILTTDDDAKDGQRDHEASAPDADGGVDSGLVAEVVLGQ